MRIDVGAFVQALREDPAQQAALRDALGVQDLDVHGALADLAQAQQRTEIRLEQLAQAQQRTEVRLEELARDVTALAQAQQRTEARVDELAKGIAELAKAQARTEHAVNGLLDVVAGMHDRLAKLDGSDLERRYRERGPSHLLRVARRLRLVGSATLAVMVDDAQNEGDLTEFETESLMLTDAVFTGQRRNDRSSVHLAVEVSVTVARNDVRRARERADLLARIVDNPVLAVVAGDHIPEPVAHAAQDADVWCVARGKVLSPQDDFDEFI